MIDSRVRLSLRVLAVVIIIQVQAVADDRVLKPQKEMQDALLASEGGQFWAWQVWGQPDNINTGAIGDKIGEVEIYGQ